MVGMAVRFIWELYFCQVSPRSAPPNPAGMPPPPTKKGDILFLAQLQAEQNASGCWLSVAGHLLLNLGDGHSNCMQYIFTGISDLMISDLAKLRKCNNTNNANTNSRSQ